MRPLIFAIVFLQATSAFAQGKPPMVGDKPLVQVQPKGAKSATPKSNAKGSPAQRLQACLDIEDGSKGRLECYDGVIAPQPKPKPPAAKAVADCRFTKEEDERLTCFNGFVESMPKLPKP